MDDFCLYEVILYFISHVCQLTDMFSFGSMLENAHIYFIYWSLKFFPYTEASAKTKDGVQCAFEELVEKILQTPGLWESENQGQKVRLGDQEHARPGACGGYCSIPWNEKAQTWEDWLVTGNGEWARGGSGWAPFYLSGVRQSVEQTLLFAHFLFHHLYITTSCLKESRRKRASCLRWVF